MKKFTAPQYEVICFSANVITTSGCKCDVGGVPFETDETCPNLNLPECSCKLNTTDPNLGNCV